MFYWTFNLEFQLGAKEKWHFRRNFRLFLSILLSWLFLDLVSRQVHLLTNSIFYYFVCGLFKTWWVKSKILQFWNDPYRYIMVIQQNKNEIYVMSQHQTCFSSLCYQICLSSSALNTNKRKMTESVLWDQVIHVYCSIRSDKSIFGWRSCWVFLSLVF